MAAIEIYAIFYNISSKTTFFQVFEIKIDNLRLTSSVFSSEANNLLTFIATGQSLGFNHNVLKHFILSVLASKLQKKNLLKKFPKFLYLTILSCFLKLDLYNKGLFWRLFQLFGGLLKVKFPWLLKQDKRKTTVLIRD